MNLNLTQPTYDAAALKIPSNAVEFKILVANIATGKIGTLTIPLSEVDPAE